MQKNSYTPEDIAREAERILLAGRLRDLAAQVLERGESGRTHARSLVRNGLARLTLTLEHGSERAFQGLSRAGERWVERGLVAILMRLASLIDGSSMPDDPVAAARRIVALGKDR